MKVRKVKKVKKMKMAPRRLRSLMGILISQIPNCEMDEILISNSTLSLVVSVNAIYSPMASEPISCMLDSMRMSQTLAENGTTSVILTCLHIYPLLLSSTFIEKYYLLEFWFLFTILLVLVYFDLQKVSNLPFLFFFTSPFLPFTRWPEL